MDIEKNMDTVTEINPDMDMSMDNLIRQHTKTKSFEGDKIFKYKIRVHPLNELCKIYY